MFLFNLISLFINGRVIMLDIIKLIGRDLKKKIYNEVSEV